MKTTLTILGLYMVSNPIILPGTNYCGPGGQQNKDDHPLYPGTDKCCQQHDQCPEQIPRFTWKFELYNFGPYTLSLCDCDKKFLDCLKMCYRCHALNWQMAEFASKEPFGEGASKKSKDKLQN